MSPRRRLRIVDGPTEEAFMETALKVAFATTDMSEVNQHFGAAESFAVYAVDQERSKLLEATQFGRLAMDGNEEKLAAKINALEGCIAVYANAIGASAIGQLKAKGVQPVKVSPGAPIAELIQSLQEELRAGPGAWLARALERNRPRDPERFDEMEEEGWSE